MDLYTHKIIWWYLQFRLLCASVTYLFSEIDLDSWLLISNKRNRYGCSSEFIINEYRKKTNSWAPCPF